MTQSPTRRTGGVRTYGGTHAVLLSSPACVGGDTCTVNAGWAAASAGARVGQRGRPLGHPGRGQGGGEDGVGAVDRPAVLGVEDDVDLGHVAGGQDAERADGQVDRLPVASTAMPSLHTSPAPGARRRGVGAQGHRIERSPAQTSTATVPRSWGAGLEGDAARPRRAASRRPGPAAPFAVRPRPRAARARRQHLGPAGPAQVGADRRSGDVDLLDSTPGATARPGPQLARSGEPGVRPMRTTPVRRAQAERQRRPLRAVTHDVLPAPQHPDRARLVGQRPGPGGTGCAACPRRRRRWPAARPAGRGGTSWRRARRRPARPRSSGG
jgi:hypothetical protein